MHTILGCGNKVIVYQNQDQSTEINTLLDRCIHAWNTMLHIGYPNMQRMNREYKLVFTDEINTCLYPILSVNITQERFGLYYYNAFAYQLAKKYQEKHYIKIYKNERICKIGSSDIEFGIGGQDNVKKIGIELQEMIFSIPLWI